MDNKLVRNGWLCFPTPLVHRLVAEYHDALHLTTSSVEKHWKEINHGVEGEGLYKAVELQCQTCPSCAIHTHDTKRKQGYMTPMPIPMEPMDSIALDVFHYPSTSHDREVGWEVSSGAPDAAFDIAGRRSYQGDVLSLPLPYVRCLLSRSRMCLGRHCRGHLVHVSQVGGCPHMCPWVGPRAPSFGRQLWGLPSRVEYLSPQGVLLLLVYGTTA